MTDEVRKAAERVGRASVSDLVRRNVSVCGVPHLMEIVDGGVLFSNKSGFWGFSTRIMFEYRSNLWYLVDSCSTYKKIPLCHLAKMHKLLTDLVGGDHCEADGTKFELRFRGEA